MKKEFEALEIIGAEKLARGELIRNDDKLEPYIAILKQALTELKEIKEANPSEAMECLEELKNFRYGKYKILVCQTEMYDTIKQALLKAQEQEKVLEIIKEKNVDIEVLKLSTSWLEYYTIVRNKTFKNTELTQEEFDLLKRWSEK